MTIPGRCSMALLTAILCWPAAAASEVNPSSELRPFSAVYHLSLAGMLLGEVKVSLSVSKQGGYEYLAHTLPRGPMRLFRDDEITEESRGVVENRSIRPERYRYRHRQSDKHRVAELKFDHARGRVVNDIRGSRWTMPVPPGVQDKFSQQLALIQGMMNGAEEIEFPVADGGKLKFYRYERIEVETVDSPAGSFEAVALARRKNDRPSRMTIWLAPSLRFLPVRIEKRESNERVNMLLQSVTWNP